MESVWSSAPVARGFYVYVLWGYEDDRPLYVGQSRNLYARLGQHMRELDRIEQIYRIEVAQCETQTAMDQLEASLIGRYLPYFNIMSNPAPGMRRGESTRNAQLAWRAGRRLPKVSR